MNQTLKKYNKALFYQFNIQLYKKEIQNYKDGTIKIWTVHLLQEHTILSHCLIKTSFPDST